MPMRGHDGRSSFTKAEKAQLFAILQDITAHLKKIADHLETFERERDVVRDSHIQLSNIMKRHREQ